MACHQQCVDVPSRAAPGHGEPHSGSQADARLVPMSVSLLLKHYNNSKQELQEIDGKLTMVEMKAKLKKYKSKLVQEPAIIAAYLNP
jgi:hypothetical protein